LFAPTLFTHCVTPSHRHTVTPHAPSRAITHTQNTTDGGAPQGRFDPQFLEIHGVLWMLNEGVVLAACEGPRSGVSLTARLFSVEGVCGRVCVCVWTCVCGHVCVSR
jgi:hypothetical protein